MYKNSARGNTNKVMTVTSGYRIYLKIIYYGLVYRNNIFVKLHFYPDLSFSKLTTSRSKDYEEGVSGSSFPAAS
jgi:hypothetical protein